ncbi:uncharacterized protein LY89DRAFT_728526 [Mollisia scopiformis]|uniref:CFEM domain-containing protein n=1 Tax=Mollisia scopiformis TaxID=149040 RepID=A0A194XRL7_MOLSC|nr:uncharacterized protein LY89DRAFT_728526 [Mollisia scopiformis]KUJ22372.1 hypothetical protein LY89DRAFT_728526 [Mollisia scopiformis]
MKFTLIALFGGLVAAQTFQGLPLCATSCLTAFESGSTIAGCNSLDITCICSNQSFLGSIACCLAANCDAADQQAATQYAINLCKANLVTNLPTAVSCTSTATSGSTGSAATPATTSAPSNTGSTGIAKTASTTAHTSSSSTTAASQTQNAAHQRTPGVGVGLVGGLAAVAVFL